MWWPACGIPRTRGWFVPLPSWWLIELPGDLQLGKVHKAVILATTEFHLQKVYTSSIPTAPRTENFTDLSCGNGKKKQLKLNKIGSLSLCFPTNDINIDLFTIIISTGYPGGAKYQKNFPNNIYKVFTFIMIVYIDVSDFACEDLPWDMDIHFTHYVW